MLQVATSPALVERCSLCPHVSPAVVPMGCWVWGQFVCRLTECQVMGRDPETHRTQHGGSPRNRDVQAWLVLCGALVPAACVRCPALCCPGCPCANAWLSWDYRSTRVAGLCACHGQVSPSRGEAACALTMVKGRFLYLRAQKTSLECYSSLQHSLCSYCQSMAEFSPTNLSWELLWVSVLCFHLIA